MLTFHQRLHPRDTIDLIPGDAFLHKFIGGSTNPIPRKKYTRHGRAAGVRRIPALRLRLEISPIRLYNPAVKTIQPGLLDKAVDLLKMEFQPEEIYLFGSHAWGTPHEDSDVDLMVIIPESTERSIKRMQRAHRCLGNLDMSKDVFVQTRAEFDRYRHLATSLQPHILRRRRKLYG